MSKDKKKDRAFESSRKREKRRATLAGEKLVLPFILGATYPEDHPHAPGERPVIREKVEAVAAGRTSAPPTAVAWCRTYLKTLAYFDQDNSEFLGSWETMGHDADQGAECDCCKCREAAGVS